MVKVNKEQQIFEVFEKVEDEDLGKGYASDVFKVRYKDAPAENTQMFAAKYFKPHAYWTIENELHSLKRTEHSNIIKLYEVFDNREQEEVLEKNVYFVYELATGGSLGKYIKKSRDDPAKDVCKEQFLKWALTMAQVVRYLHDEVFIMHMDLHLHNWFLREDGEVVLGDFGCSKILGPNGKQPLSIPRQWGPSAPEMTEKGGFSFSGDTHVLGGALGAIINQGHWDRNCSHFGQDVADLLAQMREEDPEKRPQMAAVVERLQQIKEDFAKEQSKPYELKTELLFDVTNPDNLRLKEFWATANKFTYQKGEDLTEEVEYKLYNAVKVNENVFKSVKPVVPEHMSSVLKAIDNAESSQDESMHFGIPSSVLFSHQIDVEILYELPDELRVEMLSTYDFFQHEKESQNEQNEPEQTAKQATKSTTEQSTSAQSEKTEEHVNESTVEKSAFQEQEEVKDESNNMNYDAMIFEQFGGIDPEFLQGLPDEMVQEILQNHDAMQAHTQQYQQPSVDIASLIESMKDPKVRREMLEELKDEQMKTLSTRLRKEALSIKNDGKALYIGTKNNDGQVSGKGAYISSDGLSLYEGHFKDGKKHGPGRLIKLSWSKPVIKIKFSVFVEGVPQGTFKEVKILTEPISAKAPEKIEREYTVQNGQVVEPFKQACRVTFNCGKTFVGDLINMKVAEPIPAV